MHNLEKLRAHPPKFMCFNDDLNETHPDSAVMRELDDFFNSLYPIRSPYELAPGKAAQADPGLKAPPGFKF